MIVTDDWRTPRCPGCDQPPALHMGGPQAFCGNDDCRVLSWDRDMDAEAQLWDAAVVDLPNVGPPHAP